MACGRGATRVDVDANPQAVMFYEAVEFTAVGETQTRFWTCTADVAVRRARKPRFGDRQG